MVCNIKEVAPEVSCSIKEVELHVAHNVQVEIVAEVQEEQNGTKMKFDVITDAMMGSGVKEVMQLDGLMMMKVTEQSRCANWDPDEVVNVKEQIEMLDVKEAEILVNIINKVGLQLSVKEVRSSSGAIKKALLVVLFLLRFVNRCRPDCPIELSDYG